MLAVLGASLVPRERDVFLSRWPTHWLIQGADSANRVQNQTTRYPYMVARQRKTDHVNVVLDTISWLSQSKDIFTKFNEVNLQLQGNGVKLIKAKSAIFTSYKFNAVQTKSSPS